MKRNLVLAVLAGTTIVLFQNCGGSLPDVSKDLASTNAASKGDCAFGGGYVPNHTSITAYSTQTGTSTADCSAAAQQRSCSDGVLSGTFTYGSCSILTTTPGTTGPQKITLTVASNALNYNIFSAAGSPTAKVDVSVTVSAGVVIGSASTSLPALTTGSFPGGATIQIINNGYIVGAGGSGGTGGMYNSSGAGGAPGGPAISLGNAVTIMNNGVIGGGGGGGGGGAGCQHGIGAGGGGGGAGSVGSAGGAGGAGLIAGTYPSGTDGFPGAGGSITGGGAGGGGGNPAGSIDCNYGGPGGALGAAGATGPSASLLTYGGGPGAGGAPGAAIVSNGLSAIFTNGGAGTANLLGAIQ